MTRGWPARLSEGPVGLRPIRQKDAKVWREVRAANLTWLAPWEATPPGGFGSQPAGFAGMVRMLRAQARAGSCLPFAVTYSSPGDPGRFVGQLTVSGITYGSACWAQIGYWIDQAYAGRSIIPTAVALATDHCFFVLGLHRIEINIRPENIASLRVVEKLGFREEGTRRAYLHINGAWRDHLTFALSSEEVPDGLLARWRRTRSGTIDGDIPRHTG